MPGIFISYRNIHRSYAPMLIDRELGRRFGPDSVFQAGRSNLPGTAFPAEIGRRLRECSLLIVLIDPPWVDEDLDLLFKPRDWVRREISHALKHGKQVLPVLLDGVSMPKSALLPEDIAPLTQRIALRMEARSADTDLLRLIGEVERLIPDLVLATLTDPPPPAPDPAQTAVLLRAEYEIFPFRPRRELDQLTSWCTDRVGPPVRLVTGPASAGKTRLALRLAALLRGQDWSAGLLSESAPERALERLSEIATPCLVVIDDAETRPGQVQAALRSLATADHAPGRLLLLARSTGNWLDQLHDDRDDRVAAVVNGVVPLPLEPLLPVAEDFGIACASFASWRKLPIPPLPAELPAFATLLELQAAALTHLLSPRSAAGPPLQRILELERNYWKRAAATFGLTTLRRRNLEEIMAAVTLFGADTEQEANELIASMRALRGRPVSDVDSCRDLLRTALPGPAPVNPVQPTQLGEDLVASFLRSGGALPGAIAVATDRQAERALVVLGHCLDRHPDVRNPVIAFLAENPARLLPLAMSALAALPKPELLAGPMREMLDRVPDADLSGLVAALPQRSEVLADFAVAATERALAMVRQSGAGGISTARLARLLATRLAYSRERPADAAEAARAAIRELTALAGTAPELPAELAEAHAALALALDMAPRGESGALGAGAEAVAAYRALPGGDRHNAALATALNNQANRLKRAGQLKSALAAAAEAHGLTTPLHEARPGRFGSLHADVEDTLSVLLALNDMPGPAERVGREALALRRMLATSRPDAYRPQLAGTLYNLGLILAGHREDQAEVRALWTESAVVFGDLAARQPRRFGDQHDRVLRHLRDLAPASDD
ncbi:MAG TPA: TIR domain-containing protein [Streptosporangiaceae bacterium]